ncbi:MAG: DNA photolyase family protein [Gammaproteobacteria bacterium]|nr:DNA photolyase family protein [Gammaproteobacteria bacterium]MBU1655520.1 DNA photolyase family protein [Gammaproteobacteria bacterium]MBU1961268.1 DNA photolyase family protein [Gammaproteobacteria bacterium]
MADSVILLFRRDLRLADNPALTAALSAGHCIIPAYVQDPARFGEGAAGRWWLHHSLIALDRDLQRLGSRLILRQGDLLAELLSLVKESGAFAVYLNTVPEPGPGRWEEEIRVSLHGLGLALKSFASSLLNSPGKIVRTTGEPYRIFTPYYDACRHQTEIRRPLPPPGALNRVDAGLASVPVDSLGLCAHSRWMEGFHEHWMPGEQAALNQLSAFIGRSLGHYSQWRDQMAKTGTSRLSPFLHWGQLSPAQIFWACLEADPEGVEPFTRQLFWREFAYYLLFHFPRTQTEPFDPKFEGFPWRHDPVAFEAWAQGETGIPLVDAGMRELLNSGCMHNRARMVAASVLTKNLLIHWGEGVRLFMDCLVDADLACNVLNWQWVAGCGVDQAPFFRIFNPASQGERYDPEGAYVRHWLPELAGLPNQWLHRPWDAPGDVLSAAGVHLGRSYPAPIVDLKASRHRALDVWAQLSSTARSS